MSLSRTACVLAGVVSVACASISNSQQLSSAAASFSSYYRSVPTAVSIGASIYSAIAPSATPTSTTQVASGIKSINNNVSPGDIFASGFQILLGGFAGSDYVDIVKGYALESSSNNNFNPQPSCSIYPKANPNDAPYDVSESSLRAAIYIPTGFTYGKKPPVVFVPGSGVEAGYTYAPNLAKLVSQNGIGDPVFVNVPGNSLSDIQVSAEYVAYAVNYIACLSGRNASTISWSQGALSGQWALKYWPSVRSKLSNKISISPDYHGTEYAQFLCPGTFPTPGSDPAVCQQNYNSTFINTLRAGGGDSAYVPTTNIYTIFDEIVEPQQNPNASGFLKDVRGVGVSNTEVQALCTPLLPAGAPPYNDHEGMLYNAVTYALAADALTNNGPGQVSRINATAACSKFAADGLSIEDILATHALIPIAGANILAYQPKVTKEPPIKSYAA